MLSHLVFSSLLALTLAQQCPVNPGSGSVRYPSLTKKNITIQETLPKGAGIEGWLQVPSRLINAVWGDAGYPYAVFDQSQPNAVALFPSGHIPVIATAVLGLFLAGVLASCCCCVCCCWCCFCCFEDDDSSKDNSDHFAYKLFCFIAVLVIVVMMLSLTLAGAVIGLVANAGMSDAIGSFPSTANEAATAMRDFLDGLNEDVTTVIEGGFNFTVDCLQSRTMGLDGIFREAIGENSNLTSELNAASMSVRALDAELSAIEASLGMINTSVEAVEGLQTAISTGLTTISSTCSAAMINCSGSEVMAAVNNLDMETSVLAPLQTIMSTKLMTGNVQSQLGQLNASLMEFSNGVETSLQTVMSNLTSSLRDDITGAVGQFSSGIVLVNTVLDTFVNSTSLLQTEPLEPTQPLLTYTTVRDLWYWFAVIFCVMVLLAIFLISLGLVVGGIPYSCLCVPKRRRISNIGSRLLLVSLGTSILTGALLLPVAAVCFYVGASGQELCEPLTSDERFAATLDNEEWRSRELRIILERALDPSEGRELTTLLIQATVGISFAQGLRACQANQSLWTAFQLEQLLATHAALSTADQSFRSFNLTSLLDMFNNAIDSTAVTADAMNALTAVSNNISGYGIVTFPVISLEKISSYANQSMAAISSAEDAFSSLETRLQDLRANITANQTLVDMVDSILSNVAASLGHLGNISNSLSAIEASRMNVEAQAATLNSSLAQLPLEVMAVSGALSNSSSSLYQAVTSDVQSVIDGALDYRNYVLESLRDVGRCFPLWAGYNNVRNNVCLDLINYLNAYWYSLGWCTFWLVLLFLPVVILAVSFRSPLERHLSMKDHAKITSRGIELLNVTNRENGWAWRRPSEYARDKNLGGVSQPVNQPLLFNDLPFERTASNPVSTQSTWTKHVPQDPAFERTTSYSKSTFCSQGAKEPAFERSPAPNAMRSRPLPDLPSEFEEMYANIEESPQIVSQGRDSPAAKPAKEDPRNVLSHDNAAAAAAAVAPQDHSHPTEPEEVTVSAPHEQPSATEAKQQISQDEAEEGAPLLQEKSSERMKHSTKENVVKDDKWSTEAEMETIENPHASEDEGRNASSEQEEMQTNGPQEEDVEEEDQYVIVNLHQSQGSAEEEEKTMDETASSSQEDIEGGTISFDDVESD